MTKRAAYYALLELGYTKSRALLLSYNSYPFMTFDTLFMYNAKGFTYVVDTKNMTVDAVNRKTGADEINIKFDDFKKTVAAQEGVSYA